MSDPSPTADDERVIEPRAEPRCPVSKSGMCLQMVEGFAPCDDVAECEYAPNPNAERVPDPYEPECCLCGERHYGGGCQ